MPLFIVNVYDGFDFSYLNIFSTNLLDVFLLSFITIIFVFCIRSCARI